MNVLLVQISDYLRGGGGAIASYRLHLSLKQAGVQSRILCGIKTLDSQVSVAMSRTSPLERRLQKITRSLGLNDIHNISSFQIPAGGQGKSWAHPVVCGGRLYLRHGDLLFVYNVKE